MWDKWSYCKVVWDFSVGKVHWVDAKYIGGGPGQRFKGGSRGCIQHLKVKLLG